MPVLDESVKVAPYCAVCGLPIPSLINACPVAEGKSRFVHNRCGGIDAAASAAAMSQGNGYYLGLIITERIRDAARRDSDTF